MFRRIAVTYRTLVALPAARYNASSAQEAATKKPEETTCKTTTTSESGSPSRTSATAEETTFPTTTSFADAPSANTTPATPSRRLNDPLGHDPNSGALKVNADGEFEPLRWIQQPYEDPALQPVVDENGQYIVSKTQWPTGELAYKPIPLTDVSPRFGYNIVSVKKPQTYWSYWRKNPHFNVTYAGIQFVFIIGLAWIMGFLMEEIRGIEQEGRVAGNHAGEVRGKGRTDRKKEKISFSNDEQQAMLSNAQESYLDGAETKYLGNRDYKMKKISRPSEYTYDEFRKR